MKKVITILSIAALACACNKAGIATSNNGFGNIAVVVSNDNAMVSKAVQSVEDFSTWTVKVGEVAYTGVDQKFTAGTYTVSASNYADEAAANAAKSGWGDAFYTGQNESVVVTAGATTEAAIACGTAKNARLAVEFNTATFGEFITDYKVTVAKSGVTDGLEFNAGNAGVKAYFAANTADVAYTIAYKYNGAEKSINKTITLGGAATEKKITIAANNNGKILITISYDDAFESAGADEIEIDAATGEEISE